MTHYGPSANLWRVFPHIQTFQPLSLIPPSQLEWHSNRDITRGSGWLPVPYTNPFPSSSSRPVHLRPWCRDVALDQVLHGWSCWSSARGGAHALWGHAGPVLRCADVTEQSKTYLTEPPLMSRDITIIARLDTAVFVSLDDSWIVLCSKWQWRKVDIKNSDFRNTEKSQ